MSIVQVDSNSRVHLDKNFKESLAERAAAQAQEAVDLVNKLYEQISANKGEVPGPGTTPSKNISLEAQKLVQKGVGIITKGGKSAEAIDLYTKALETVLSRPLYESMQATMGEVCQVLGPRCDAYMAAKQWAKAYADSCMLVLLNPKDPHGYFRKAVCLFEADQVDESEIMLEYAVMLAPQSQQFKAFLDKVKEQKSACL